MSTLPSRAKPLPTIGAACNSHFFRCLKTSQLFQGSTEHSFTPLKGLEACNWNISTLPNRHALCTWLFPLLWPGCPQLLWWQGGARECLDVHCLRNQGTKLTKQRVHKDDLNKTDQNVRGQVVSYCFMIYHHSLSLRTNSISGPGF